MRLPNPSTIGSLIILPAAGTFFYTCYNIYTGNEQFSRDILMPLVRKCFDGETAHKLALRALQRGYHPGTGDNLKEYESLHTSVCGMPLKNPIGLAAGFDKDALCVTALANVCHFILF
jgi:hypothetical protein